MRFFKRKVNVLTVSEFRIEYAKELISYNITPIKPSLMGGSPEEDYLFAVDILTQYIKYLQVCGVNQKRIDYLQKEIDEVGLVYWKGLEFNKRLKMI